MHATHPKRGGDRTLQTIWFVALASIQASGGCCNEQPPAPAREAVATDVSGTLWLWSQEPLVISSRDPERGCEVTFPEADLREKIWDADTDPIPTQFRVDCARQGSSMGDMFVRLEVPDLREASTGTMEFPLDYNTLRVTYEGGACDGTPPPQEGSIVVEKSVGTKAPYPDLVTDDFLRAVEVEVSLAAASGVPQACDVVGVRMVLAYEQIASDYRTGSFWQTECY